MKKLLISLLLLSTTLSAFAAEHLKNVKYVFLFIGDGMSIPQRMMVKDYLNAIGKEDLLINQMPHSAVTSTNSADSFITDSAASGTAIACGEKTKNHYLGVRPDLTNLTSVAEVAKKRGRKVGIITSVTLNHATPAAFYAHKSDRGSMYEIALDLIASNFDFFGGGGIEKYNDEKSKAYKGDIFDLAKEQGYEVVVGDKALDELEKGKKVIAVQNKSSAIPYFIDNPNTLRIADYTEKAIELLDNPKGFFMMVEGGKIDWMCHANDAATTLQEVLDFDRAVGVALDFAKKHPNETLVVVTGDHETGGLSLGFAGTGYSLHMDVLANQKTSRDTFKNNISKLVKKNESATFEDTMPFLTESFGFDFSDNKSNKLRLKTAEKEELKKSFEKALESKKMDSFANDALRIFNNKAGLSWSSNAHTALPVLTTASGVNAQIFSGIISNTDISKKLKTVIK